MRRMSLPDETKGAHPDGLEIDIAVVSKCMRTVLVPWRFIEHVYMRRKNKEWPNSLPSGDFKDGSKDGEFCKLSHGCYRDPDADGEGSGW
jgi:hypothetical protein